MDLKNPKSKIKHHDSNFVLPIFIESELGISLQNWVPVVCTGVFDGFSVVVRSPAEMSALFTMGNFGKGSNSRSQPHVCNNIKSPMFLRKRQYTERIKWSGIINPKSTTDTKKHCVVEELHFLFEELLKKNIISRHNNTNKSDIVNILPCDEEVSDCKVDLKHSNQESTKNKDVKSFPLNNSVVILPDSDDEENYFQNLKPKLEIDDSNLCESLILFLEEAYFLAYGLGCLQISDKFQKKLSLEESWNLFCEVKPNFFVYYAVYHYFRSKGWVVKPGIKFGGDFLLYKRGQSYYHASYIIFVRTIFENNINNEEFDWLTIQNYVRMSTTTGKEILFANVIIPKEVDISKSSPHSLQQISIKETLLRRWTSSEQKKKS